MITGVHVREITDIENEQGKIQHMLRSDDAHFRQFGEIYFSTTFPSVQKGWHIHDEQTSILSCISGTLTLALHDLRIRSSTAGETMKIILGDGQRKVVHIPPGVAYAWHNTSKSNAMLANCASHPHDPSKSRKLSFAELPFP